MGLFEEALQGKKFYSMVLFDIRVRDILMLEYSWGLALGGEISIRGCKQMLYYRSNGASY